jgi:DNA-binding HxlR family transcriptional regulator
MACPIARTLEIVGEWWTLLIIRDAFLGARRFDDFRQSGIADNILSARLDLLVREGVLARRAYQERPPRHEYVLTDKGYDLLPVIMSLGQWGLTWTGVQAPRPPRFTHERCGTDLGLSMYCPTCAATVAPREIRAARQEPLPTAVAANGPSEQS